MAGRRLDTPDGGTGTRGLSRAVLGLAALAAFGALLFGLWHVVVGGIANGNVRAASFGMALAAVSAGFLLSLWLLTRRLRRRRDEDPT